MPAAEPPLTWQRLVVLLQQLGCPPASYGIGRSGKYLDQAFVLERWSNR